MQVSSINTYGLSTNQRNFKQTFGAQMKNMEGFIKSHKGGAERAAIEIANEILTSGCENTIVDLDTKKLPFEIEVEMSTPVTGPYKLKQPINSVSEAIPVIEKEVVANILVLASEKGKLPEAANGLKENYPELTKYIDEKSNSNALLILNNSGREKTKKLEEERIALEKKQEEYRKKHPILARIIGVPEK